MTSKDIEAELDKEPFVPLRFHLVSGKAVDVPNTGVAHPMQNALLIFKGARPGKSKIEGYDVIAFRNIERIEQVVTQTSRRRSK